ncbi:MAG TPA: hypothetical protein P5228_02050 [Bacteroidales bacterium]|nr:hypothetical protein [Bacteroidales bacterium]HRZ49495.1 hypothetical protein [Bacteroidales bacterium]
MTEQAGKPQRYKWILITGILFLCVFKTMIVLAQHIEAEEPASHSAVIPDSADAWIIDMLTQMKTVSRIDSERIVRVENVDFEGLLMKRYKLVGEGFIVFPDSGWVYLISASSHDQPYVGDITLAMDHTGTFFLNRGHVCGGIIHFVFSGKPEEDTAANFFRLYVSDTDEAPWQAYELIKTQM